MKPNRFKTINVLGVINELGIQGKDNYGEYTALCPHPNHIDKAPSWSINIDQFSDLYGIFNCFGCGWSGNIVELITTILELSWYNSWKWVESKGLIKNKIGELLSISLEVIDPSNFGVIDHPSGVIVKPLDKWSFVTKNYVKSRGLTDDIINEWGIGYAIDGILSGRIYFPIKRSDGELISYSARSFSDQVTPKYIGPKIAKTGILCGEDKWVDISERKNETVIICEGVIDAIACWVAGFRNVAALCGSIADSEHILKLSSFGCVKVATDSDEAGDRAFTDINNAFGSRTKVSRIDFPIGVDAGNLLVEDVKLLKNLLCETI